MRSITASITASIAMVWAVSSVPTVPVDASAAGSCDGRTATIVAPAPTTSLPVPVEGTDGDDVIIGTNGDDVIFGKGGDDTICALAGRDEIHGGDGDDRLHGGLDGDYSPDDGYRGDVLVPGPGRDLVDLGDDPASADIADEDRFAFYDTVSYRDATGPVHVDLAAGAATGEGRDTIVVPAYSGGIVGSDFDDVLAGSAGPDRIDGGGGDDRIDARAGKDDVLPDNRGRPWSDVHWESDLSTGDDIVQAGPGNDLVWTRLGSDRVAGSSGPDYLHHEGPRGRLVGGSGRDTLHAGPRVTLLGGDDRDVLGSVLGSSSHRVDGGGDRDVLHLGALPSSFGRGSSWRVDLPRQRVLVDDRKVLDYRAIETLFPEIPGGRLTYIGGSGPDTLAVPPSVRVRATGGRGADSLSGGGFDDLLDGGPGRDVLDGNEGRDRCLRGERLRSCEVRR